MTLTFKGEQSSSQPLPAGIPQGAYLGGLIFIIKFNGAFLRPEIPRNSILAESKSEKLKYIDDGTVAVCVDLQKCLVPDDSIRPYPLNYHERTGHILPEENNMMQIYIKEAENYASRNKMVINTKKTDFMVFTNARALDFPPELYFNDESRLKIVTEKLLLGVVVSSDLKWAKNTTFMCEKARRNLWILKKMM